MKESELRNQYNKMLETMRKADDPHGMTFYWAVPTELFNYIVKDIKFIHNTMIDDNEYSIFERDHEERQIRIRKQIDPSANNISYWQWHPFKL